MKILEQVANGSNAGGLYRLLPSISDLLLSPQFAIMLQSYSHDAVVRSTRLMLNLIKEEIRAGEHTHASFAKRLSSVDVDVAALIAKASGYSLKRVINATGVVLHTNLGRSPLSQAALDHLVAVARGYSNLELDLETGERSRRLHGSKIENHALLARRGTIQPGDTAPSLTVKRLEDKSPIELGSLWSERPVVLVFGSYT